MRVECGCPRRVVLILCESCVELCVLVRPRGVFCVECLWQTAPADIAGEDFLFFRGGKTIFILNPFECLNGGKVRLEFCLCATLAQMLVCDAVHMALRTGDFRVQQERRQLFAWSCHRRRGRLLLPFRLPIPARRQVNDNAVQLDGL